MRYPIRRGAVAFTLFAFVVASGSSLLPQQERAQPPETRESPAHIFHVSSAGAADNPGTEAKPFATLNHARDAIRELKKRNGGVLKKPVTVVVHGGTYELDEPLLFTPDDSGTAECSVTYQAAPGAKPVFSGGRAISGWKEASVAGKKLWAADIPGGGAQCNAIQSADRRIRTCADDPPRNKDLGREFGLHELSCICEQEKGDTWDFRQLWVDGKRRTRARQPNEGFLRIAGLPDVTKQTPWNKGQKRFRFKPGDMKPWKNLAEVDVVVLHLWVAVRLGIESIDEKENVVTFVKPSRRRLTDGEEPARYYLENAFEFLDAPGEWYLDRAAGKLYYWPMPDEKISDVKAVAPRLPHLVRFEGQPEKGRFVEHVTLRGLTFAHAEDWPGRGDTCDAQAAVNIPAVIHANGLRRCTLDRCTVKHAGGYGIHLARGCRHNRITHCEVTDLGAGGVRIGETTIRDSAAEQTHTNTVSDCRLHHLGRIFHQAVGLWVGQSYGNALAHNHVRDLTYTGISCGWTWGYGKTLARDNVIEHNHVHDIGRGLLSDMGGIYTLGVQPGTVIRGNVFHDIAAYRYGGWGIYFDEGTSHIVAEKNLVYNTTHGGFHQHYGKENTVRNNILAFGRDAQIRRTRIESHRSFTFERNIVYWEKGKLLDGNWKELNAAFDRNLYWHAGKEKITFAGMTFEQWQAKGLDRRSKTADPRFVNPRKHDFRLGRDSPAAEVGFVPFDVSGAGPRRRIDQPASVAK